MRIFFYEKAQFIYNIRLSFFRVFLFFFRLSLKNKSLKKFLVTWLKDGKILDIDSINYETTDKGDLIVNKVDQSASGNYTCRAENIVGVRETPTASVFVWGE